MPKFRHKRRSTFEAIKAGEIMDRYHRGEKDSLPQWVRTARSQQRLAVYKDEVAVAVTGDTMHAYHSDWIICGPNGELDMCVADAFERFFEPVEEGETPERAGARIAGDAAKEAEKVLQEKLPKPPRDHIMQFFRHSQLPPEQQEIACLFSEVAEYVEREIPRTPERTVALRHLLDACAATLRAFTADKE